MNCKHGLAFCGLFLTTALFAQTKGDLWLRDAALQKALTASLAIQSDNQPLRIFLNRLSESQHVAHFLDRRLDPSTPRDLAQHERSLKSIFFSAAASGGGGACQIGDAVYLGPGSIVAALPDLLSKLRADVRALPGDAKKIWQRSQLVQYPQLSRPANLIADLAKENGLKLIDVESIPLDLWHEINLPPMSLAERFALLLVGFDKWLTISADGKTVCIVELTLPDEITRTYRTEQRTDLSEWIKQTLSDVTVQRKSANLIVTASPANQHEIARWLVDHEVIRRSLTPGAKKVVTLNDTASVGKIARQVAVQLGVEFSCDASLERQLEAQVEIHVDKVSYEELLTKVFAETDLSFELNDLQLRVFAK